LTDRTAPCYKPVNAISILSHKPLLLTTTS
jgi:hypothetical protein